MLDLEKGRKNFDICLSSKWIHCGFPSFLSYQNLQFCELYLMVWVLQRNSYHLSYRLSEANIYVSCSLWCVINISWVLYSSQGAQNNNSFLQKGKRVHFPISCLNLFGIL